MSPLLTLCPEAYGLRLQRRLKSLNNNPYQRRMGRGKPCSQKQADRGGTSEGRGPVFISLLTLSIELFYKPNLARRFPRQILPLYSYAFFYLHPRRVVSRDSLQTLRLLDNQFITTVQEVNLKCCVHMAGAVCSASTSIFIRLKK